MTTKYQMISRAINALPREWNVIACSRNKVTLKYVGENFVFEDQKLIFDGLSVQGLLYSLRTDGKAVARLSGRF